MTTFNTGNPIGSTDARDLSDNAENFDIALGTTASTWVDRLGVTRDSFEGRLAKGSFYRVGTFAAGYTLTNMRQTLEYGGHEYSWAGEFPKVVAAGATPATSGGIGAGAWVDRTQETLRESIKSITYIAENMGVAVGLLSSDEAAILNTVAMQSALSVVAANGGGVLHCPSQFYTFSGDGIRIPQGVHVVGAGVGEWEPIYPSRPKTWEGANFIFRGTGNKTKAFHGVTGMKNSGGVVTDSGSVVHSLTSFRNADASGATAATAKTFSAAVAPVSGDHYWGLKNLRIVNWIGTDGISDHSNAGSASLGANWDIGLLSDNSEYCDVENVQVVGYWREFGTLEITTAITESRSERNSFKRLKTQGRIGHGLRAPDRWDVSARTSTTAQIYWANDHYWPASGSFRGSDGLTYNYTGLTFSSPYLTFTGLDRDPTTNAINHIRHASTGFGNTEYHDIYAYSLNHVSGQSAAYFGLSDSKPLEASGYPLRGVKLRNYKCHTDESVTFHIHDAQDLIFIDPQFEGGGLLIASPVNTEGTAAAQVGETRNLVMVGDCGTEEQDLQLFKPRSGFIQSLSLNPRSDLSGDLVLTPSRADRDVVLKTKSGKNIYLRNSLGADSVRVTDSGNVLLQNGGQLSLSGSTGYLNVDVGQNFALRNGSTTRWQMFGSSGNLAPGTANTQFFGTSGLPLAGGYTQTAFTVTSDENYKQDVEFNLSDALLDIADKVDACEFRFKDRASEKGDNARYHIGIIAQKLKALFHGAGIDPFKYGILSYDSWGDTYEDEFAESLIDVKDEDGNIIGAVSELVKTGNKKLVVAAGEMYRVNYEELLMLKDKANQRRFSAIEAKINALELKY